MSPGPGGKVAGVTGAASGLGAAYAMHLAELGHDVAVCDLDWCVACGDRSAQ
jgi:NAD(P)-dependent dehydrogenase (short-subunit alcohol dehydrogenase family)